MGQTNCCFFLASDARHHIYPAVNAHAYIYFYYLSVCFFNLSIHFKPYGNAEVAVKPLDRRMQYWVSIEPALMNRWRKLNFAERGRCASLRLMRRDR